MSELRLKGIEKAKQNNFIEAEELLLSAISEGDIAAYNDLGVVKEKQMIFDDALTLYYQAAALGVTDALLNLAKMYLNGYGCYQDKELAYRFISRAVELGHPDGYALLYQEFLYHSKEMPLEEKIKFLIEGYEIEKSHSDSYECAMHLGWLLEHNSRTKEAVEYYQSASNKGFGHGTYNLGMCYLKLDNNVKGFKCLLLAAKQGYADAYAQLGLMHIVGDVTIQDKETALKYLKEAMNRNSQYGRLLYIDAGLDHDLDISMEDIKKEIRVFLRSQTHEGHRDYYNNLKNNHRNDLDWDLLESELDLDNDIYIEE